MYPYYTHLCNSSSINMKHSIAVIVDNKITIIGDMDDYTNSIYELDSKGGREREGEGCMEREKERETREGTSTLPIRADIPQTLDHSILHVPPASPSRRQGSALPLSCPLLPTLSPVEAHMLRLQKILIVHI